MDDKLKHLLTSLQGKTPYQARRIKRRILSGLTTNEWYTAKVIRQTLEPDMMYYLSFFFQDIVEKFPSLWMIDHMQRAVRRFKKRAIYPELLKRLEKVNSVFTGIILGEFSVEKAVADITGIGMWNDAKVVVDYAYKRDYEKNVLIDVKLTYSLRVPEHVLNMRVSTNKISIGKIERDYNIILFTVVAGFIERNPTAIFDSLMGNTINAEVVGKLKDVNPLSRNWYLNK